MSGAAPRSPYLQSGSERRLAEKLRHKCSTLGSIGAVPTAEAAADDVQSAATPTIAEAEKIVACDGLAD